MIRTLPVLLVLIMPAALLAQGIVPGRWDITARAVEADIPGVPGFMLSMIRGKSKTVRKCLTPAEAATGIGSLLVPKAEAKCTIQRAIVAGGRIDHAMLCPQKKGPPMSIVRTGTYTPAGFKARMTMTGTTPKGPMRIVADQTALHAGPSCK